MKNETRKSLKIGNFKVGSVRLDRNPHGKGWWLQIQIGPGGGYRWIDSPWYSHNVADRQWYKRASIIGRTMIVASNVKIHTESYDADKRSRWAFGKNHNGRYARFYVRPFTKRCNFPVFPGWW